MEQALRESRDVLEQRVEKRTAQLQQSQAELRALAHHLVEVQENERRAIAHELHDEAGQTMTALKIELSLLEQQWSSIEELARRLGGVRQRVGTVMEELHRMAVHLRPTILDRLGLVPVLDQYGRGGSQTTGVQIQVTTSGVDGLRLPSDVELALFRIAQEAVTNAVRHGRAQHVSVLMIRRSGAIVAVIEDDGIEFDLAEARKKNRLGLLAMRERAQMLGGELDIETAPGGGTSCLVADSVRRSLRRTEPGAARE